ncbi:MAG: phosphonate ABC transporter ATP-binding protein [Parvularculaceae bacterium]|nr:phosphonate ABC transporter ATP-binding protein [Parvularculaceae bacterium]
MLDIQNLEKRFGDVVALNGVSATIEPGERVGIIGLSGAGKSTLLRSINCLETPTSGDIAFEGSSVLDLKGQALNAWRARCAMIFQQFQLVPRLDVITNVLAGGLHRSGFVSSMLKHFSADERAQAVIELDRLGIADTAFKRASQLSGGQQQRVAIARAMLQSPDILLADEPVASLDPVNSESVMSTLAQINEERGITVIINLHSIALVRSYCRRVIGLRAGRVVFDGQADDLDEDTLAYIYGRTETAPSAAQQHTVEAIAS